MKKITYIFISLLSLAALFSCSERDDLRKDIDDLNARLEMIEAMLPQMNQDIANYQGLLYGQYMIVGYSKAENGDYTLDLSNGESMEVNVYSGEPNEALPVMSIGSDGYWYYTKDGETLPLTENGNKVSADPVNGKTPEFAVNAQGYWIYSFDGTNWEDGIGLADPGKAQGLVSIFDDVKVSPDGKSITFTWTSEGEGGATETLNKTVYIFDGLSLDVEYGETTPVKFHLGETIQWSVEQGENVDKIVIETKDWEIKVEEALMTVKAPSVNTLNREYEDKLVLKIFSKEGYCRAVTIPVKLLTTTDSENTAKAWQYFLSGDSQNKLLDYSYAGYHYGNEVPSDGFSWSGYTVYNVADYMKKNSLSARDALEDILDKNNLIRKTNPSALNTNAKIVIYFPEGEYVLQGKSDNNEAPYQIYGGNFIIKGDGPDKTKLIMEDHIGTDEGSTKALISIGHTNGPRNTKDSKSLAEITANAAKGDCTVKVSATTGITPGSWVQLRLRSANDGLLQKELGPLYRNRTDWSITKQPGYESNGISEDRNGIQVMEFHQVESVGSGEITFYDPIMSDIDVSINDYNGGWEIREYKHIENVGVEDLAFVGGESLLSPYYHHGKGADESKGWMYDYAYKPLSIQRAVNSWVRNVTFESISEAVTFDQSANCSAYNIRITGKRGHSAVRAQESTRVFIGKVRDESIDEIGHGQYHGCGVSKPSIGTVIWNVTWGQDACFESHATQPRATLFDNCSGGLVYYHAGGAETEAPNHLRDLTIWNLNVTGTTDEKGRNFWKNDFHWWLPEDTWWKIYPPIVVGTHGQAVTFSQKEGQLTYEESTGTKVTPESLYEAQLRQRFGVVPPWLNALK